MTKSKKIEAKIAKKDVKKSAEKPLDILNMLEKADKTKSYAEKSSKKGAEKAKKTEKKAKKSSSLRLGIRVDAQDKELIEKICDERGEQISDFVRRSVKKELVSLGLRKKSSKKIFEN